MRPSVGLIGYGRFGRFAARWIGRHARIVVFDPRLKGVASPSVARGTFGEAAGQPIVVLAVPISTLPPLLQKLRKHVRPDALILDVCSVKVYPVRWMKRALSRSVSIIGLHPLFGPDSAATSLRGKRLVVCPVRVRKAHMVTLRRLAAREGLRCHVMSPAAHDRLMADTLLASQYAGRLMVEARVPLRAWSTPSYDHLRVLREIAGRDSLQLFRDMWRYNPYAARLARRLDRSHRLLMRELRQVG
ncbi:MAG: prephenate dehydrogenase [Bacteroidota bacterium]